MYEKVEIGDFDHKAKGPESVGLPADFNDLPDSLKIMEDINIMIRAVRKDDRFMRKSELIEYFEKIAGDIPLRILLVNVFAIAEQFPGLSNNFIKRKALHDVVKDTLGIDFDEIHVITDEDAKKAMEFFEKITKTPKKSPPKSEKDGEAEPDKP